MSGGLVSSKKYITCGQWCDNYTANANNKQPLFGKVNDFPSGAGGYSLGKAGQVANGKVIVQANTKSHASYFDIYKNTSTWLAYVTVGVGQTGEFTYGTFASDYSFDASDTLELSTQTHPSNSGSITAQHTVILEIIG